MTTQTRRIPRKLQPGRPIRSQVSEIATVRAVSVSGTDGLERPDAEMEITLFRIAQEALTNVAKHAHATRAQIELDQTDDRCRMTVRDDGVGIVGAGRERPGLGMVTMRERHVPSACACSRSLRTG